MTAELHRRVWGDGPRRALLLHGSTSSSASWWRVGSALGELGWSVVALDLPSHGGSPAADRALLPDVAASRVAAMLSADTFDVVVGHSFGAAVAVALAAARPAVTRRLVLEELPGGSSVDWAAEADAVLSGVRNARDDADSVVQQTHRDQPRWTAEDCQHSVADLARCVAGDISAGLRAGDRWVPLTVLHRVQVPTTLLLAPDRPGVNRLDDSTALRGSDRTRTVRALHADAVVSDAGHCIHRDSPDDWLRVVAALPPRS